CELLQLAAGLELEPAVLAQRPAALPLLLVLVAARVALAGPGLDIVEPHVFGALAVRPRLFARDRARVAADALVEVHHHRHLRHDSPRRASCSRVCVRCWSCVWAMASVLHVLIAAAADHGDLVALIACGPVVVEREGQL